MPTVILEGPDSSGKTTLAYALLGWLGPDLGHYVKSPAGRTKVWDEAWNIWNASMVACSIAEKKLYILDRTPEISELVYGPVIRGHTRLRDPLSSLLRLNHPDTLIIMTSTDKVYQGHQEDPMGNPIYEQRHQVKISYELIGTLMKYHGYQIGTWDYEESRGSWISHRLLSLFKTPMKIPMENSSFQEYVNKGKEIVNGS